MRASLSVGVGGSVVVRLREEVAAAAGDSEPAVAAPAAAKARHTGYLVEEELV